MLSASQSEPRGQLSLIVTTIYAHTHTDMDNVRGSLSGLKHGVGHLLERNKRKADKMWPDGRGERSHSPGPPALPESQVVADSDREGEGNESNMDVERHMSGVAPDENRSDWKSTVSASAKLLLRGVRDSADAFGPLKSIAGGLCFILENYEVRLPPSYPVLNAHRSHSVRRQIRGQLNRWHPGSTRLPNGSASPFLWVISGSEKGETDLSSKSALCKDGMLNLTYVDGQEIVPDPHGSTPTGKSRKGRGVLQKHQEFWET